MAAALDDARRALREAADRAPTISIALDADYLQAIAALEALPSNQSGADKTWILRAEASFRQHYARARRVAG